MVYHLQTFFYSEYLVQIKIYLSVKTLLREIRETTLVLVIIALLIKPVLLVIQILLLNIGYWLYGWYYFKAGNRCYPKEGAKFCRALPLIIRISWLLILCVLLLEKSNFLNLGPIRRPKRLSFRGSEHPLTPSCKVQSITHEAVLTT